MEVLRGIAVSPGLVIGRIFLLEDEQRRVVRRFTPASNSAEEAARVKVALETSVADLQAVKQRAEDEMGSEAAKIFLFHIGVLQDPSLRDPIFERIENERMAAEHAVEMTFADWARRFAGMGDSAFTTKVNDLEDLRNRVLGHLMGEHNRTLDELKHQAVVVADDLTPSQAAGFNRDLVQAFVTDRGGRTSHTAIVARALNIPAVVGLRGVAKAAEEDQTIIVDGLEGVVILDPTDEQLDRYKARQARMERRQTVWKEQAGEPSVTTDGVHIRLMGNIEFPDEIAHVLEVGGEGVGLYRTEFLYLTSDTEPSEEQHYDAYRRCVEQMQGRELVVRTVDLGADKYTQHRFEQPERNPFLGNRSIRYCLSDLPMFKRQLRAILRASAHGPLKIMFPLITTVQELRQAKSIVRDVMEDLAEEGVPFDRDVPMGMMVEVPAAAVIASSFARDAAFFSIGTNDLVQYTLAVDRTNEHVADLFTAMHPAVLRLVRDVMRGAKSRQIPVSCCGESAAELDFAVLLIGLGVRTLSVGSYSIPQVKKLVRSVSAEECTRIARRALSLESPSDVTAYVRERVRRVMPGVFDSSED
jgi:phosphotransferase system enzyme I (PtsI)